MVESILSHYQKGYCWGYNKASFNKAEEGEHFQIYIPSPTHDIQSIRKEYFLGVAALKEEHGREDIVVGLSGGLDSQMLCFALKELGVDFRVASLVMIYKNKIINQEELKVAKAFSDKYCLTQDLIEIQLEERIPFYKYLVRKFYPIHWIYLFQLEVALKYQDALVILNNGNPHVKPENKDFYQIDFSPDILAITKSLGLNVIPHFYWYHPNLYYAFLFHPLMRKFSLVKESLLDFYSKSTDKSFFNTEQLFVQYIRPLMFIENFSRDEIFYTQKINTSENKEWYYDLKNDLIKMSNNKTGTNSVTLNFNDWIALYQKRNQRMLFQ